MSAMEKSFNAIKWVLLGSLLVNAAFAGFVFSQVTNRWGLGFGERRPGPMREMVVRGNFIKGSPNPERAEQTRAVLDKVFASEKGDMDQAVRDWVQARRKTVQALRTQPLDKAALEASLADLRAKATAAQVVYHRIVLQAAPELSVEERGLLGPILNASPNRFSTGMDSPGMGGQPRMMPLPGNMPSMMPPPGEGGAMAGPPPAPKQ